MKWRLAPLRHTQILPHASKQSVESHCSTSNPPEQRFATFLPTATTCGRMQKPCTCTKFFHSAKALSALSCLRSQLRLLQQQRIVHTRSALFQQAAGRLSPRKCAPCAEDGDRASSSAREREESRRQRASERDRRHFHSSDNARIKIITTSRVT
jgi:hypothetical protein